MWHGAGGGAEMLQPSANPHHLTPPSIGPAGLQCSRRGAAGAARAHGTARRSAAAGPPYAPPFRSLVVNCGSGAAAGRAAGSGDGGPAAALGAAQGGLRRGACAANWPPRLQASALPTPRPPAPAGAGLHAPSPGKESRPQGLCTRCSSHPSATPRPATPAPAGVHGKHGHPGQQSQDQQASPKAAGQSRQGWRWHAPRKDLPVGR